MVPPPRIQTHLSSSSSPSGSGPGSSSSPESSTASRTGSNSTIRPRKSSSSSSPQPPSNLLAPATIEISPPSPIDPKGSPFLSTPPRPHTSQSEGDNGDNEDGDSDQVQQYDSPEEESDNDDHHGNEQYHEQYLDVHPRPKSRRTSSSASNNMNPNLQPPGGGGGPLAAYQISQSPSKESSLLSPEHQRQQQYQHPEADSKHTSQSLSRTSSNASNSPHPHIPLARTPSPSSPHYRPKGSHHRRESSTHRVKESQGETRNTEDGGRMVNQYKIGKSLGRGAYATVELGVDAQTGKEYAIKEFSKSRLHYQSLQDKQRQNSRNRMRMAHSRTPTRTPAPGRKPDEKDNDFQAEAGAQAKIGAGATDEEQGGRLGPWGGVHTVEEDPLGLVRREIAVMKKLDHPNLVHLHEAISVPHEDALFLVLEYLPGGVLMDVHLGPSDIPNTPPFPAEQSREYFRQLCLGLEYLHFNGVIHRDIKPDNILLSADREVVKLCDFGVSEMFVAAGDDTVKKSGGSPAFLSPESFISHRHEIHGKAVDIWALGVTLYCMMAGELPFNVVNPMELFEVVMNKDPDMSSDWAPEFQDLIKRMLAKDPTERINMESIREHAWVTANGEEPMISTEDNLYHVGKQVEEPTQEELSNAVSHLRNAFTVARAVQKFRRGLHRSRSNNPNLPSSPSTQPGSFDSYATMMTQSSDTTGTSLEDGIGAGDGDKRDKDRYQDLMGQEVMSPTMMADDEGGDGDTLGMDRFRLDTESREGEGKDKRGEDRHDQSRNEGEDDSSGKGKKEGDGEDGAAKKRGELGKLQTDVQDRESEQQREADEDGVQMMDSPVSDEGMTPISRG